MNNKDTKKDIAEEKPIDYRELSKQLQIDLTIDIPPPEIAVTIGGEILGTIGNLSVIMGQAKSKKTFLVSAIVAAMLSDKTLLNVLKGELPNHKKKILYFDTEQSEYHVQRVARRICYLAGVKNNTEHLKVFKLNPIGTNTRRNLIEYIMQQADMMEGVGAIIIDGARDLLFDINSPEEATTLVDHIRQWTDKNGIHLLTVLHGNKTDGKLRGHLGTEFLNKGETVIEVAVDKQDKNISVASCHVSRNRPFEDFAFRFDENHNPVGCEIPAVNGESRFIAGETIKQGAMIDVLLKLYENNRNSTKNKGQLKDHIKLKFEIGETIARQIIAYCEDNDIIENTSSKKTSFSYILSDWVGQEH